MTLALTHSSLHRAASELDAAAERLRDTKNTADGQVSSLVGSGWTGSAADAFLDAWESWRRGADEVVAGLLASRQALDVAHHDLSATDDEVAERCGTVAGRLVERLG